MTATYLDTSVSGSNTLLEAAIFGLVIVGDDADVPYRVIEGSDDDVASCAVLVPGDSFTDEHPVGSWNIAYPYARTAINIWVADPDPNRQVAQLAPMARYLGIRLRLLDDDQIEEAAKLFAITVEPPQLFNCAVAAYAYPGGVTPYLLIDTNYVEFPSRIYFVATDHQDRVRRGWIGLRDHRAGAPSGSKI